MSSTRVNWSALKTRVTIPMLLEHCDIGRAMTVTKSGALKGPCLIHSTDPYSDESESFRVTVPGRGFKRFGCNAAGSIIDLVAARESVTPKQAGQLIDEWFPADAGSRDKETTRAEIEFLPVQTVDVAPAAMSPRERYRSHIFRLAGLHDPAQS